MDSWRLLSCHHSLSLVSSPFRLYPILLSDQHNAMDKVWYICTYVGFAAVATWILVKNKCNIQLLNASIMFIKTLPEKSCIQFAKWCKIGFILTIISFLFHFIVFIGRFAVATIFDWYREGLSLSFLAAPV